MQDSKNCTEELPCALADEELLEMSAKLAGLHQQKLEVEGKKKEAANDFAARMKKIDGEVHLLSNNIFSKKETRDVQCRLDYFWSEGKKILVRLDTGEQVSDTVIPDYERQQYMDFVERENGKAAKLAEGEEWPEEEVVAEETPVEEEAEQSEPCPDCGAPNGEEHSDGCPMLTEAAQEEVPPEEDNSSVTMGEDEVSMGDEPEGTEETEEEPGQEESGEAEDTDPTKCTEFGDFSAEAPECADCGDKEACYEATPVNPKDEIITEEEQVESEASGETEPEIKGQYRCVECDGYFDEPKTIEEDDSTACPLCLEKNWF